MFQSVAVGLDGTRESFAAVDWAAHEARARGVPLKLVQIRETGAYPYSPIADDEVEREWAQTLIDEALDELNRRLPELHTDVEMVSGRPAHVLADVSTQTDLLVLGSRGLSTVLGFIVGSTAMPTIGHSSCPVVLIRAPHRSGEEAADETFPASESSGTAGDIVLGIDLSHPCDELLAFAFETAGRHSAALRVLHAWDLPPMYAARPLPIPPGMKGELFTEQTRALNAALHPWQERHPDIKVHAQVETGQPGRLLVEAASQASLLVVGRRSRRSRVGTHLSPVTHAVMHHARTPVAVVPHE